MIQAVLPFIYKVKLLCVIQVKSLLLIFLIYIEGPPGPPSTICSLIDRYNIKCIWSVPYTIAGVEVRSYNYNITKEDNIIEQGSVNEPEVIYVRGNYNVNVAAVIGDNFIGKVSTTEVHNKEGEIEYI